jgi:hypothetical protein
LNSQTLLLEITDSELPLEMEMETEMEMDLEMEADLVGQWKEQ